MEPRRWVENWIENLRPAHEQRMFLLALVAGLPAVAVALILLWTYYSALIFLLGVEFTQVWVRRNGREVSPKAGAVRLDQPA